MSTMNDYGGKRVVVLVDMDCFYCQVEVQHNQSLVDKPVAVVQYNSWRGGGIIAVNYEARAKGVNRHMRGDDAVQKCPELNLVRVKELHGKADLSKYRIASQKVFEVLSEFSPCVQRASIDEAYIDLTNTVNDYISYNQNEITDTDLPNTFVEGYSDQNAKEDRKESMKSWLHDVYNNELQDDMLLRLTVGAMMVEKLRESVFKKTNFRCSAGIANNKILAKLACGLHKPNQQTLLPPSSVPNLFKTISIKKVRNLGGKLGNRVKQELNCEFMSDLAAIPLSTLRQKFDDKTCNFLYQISKGIDNEPVESRLVPKSIGSCKSFPLGLKIKEEIEHWLRTLMNDIIEKLEVDYETNKRKATLITVSVRYSKKETNLPISQCGEVTTYNINKLFDTAYSMLCTMTENQKTSHWKNPLSYLGVAIGKFVKINEKSSINNYFNKEITKVEKNCPTESGKPETSLKINDTEQIKNNTACNKKDSGLKKKSSNKFSTSLNHTNTNHNVPSTSREVKNIKTMFEKMKNSSVDIDCTATVQNIQDTKTKKGKEISKQNTFNKNSFFSKKLESISPVKSQKDDKPTIAVSGPSTSSGSFFAKKLETVSPSKNIQSDEVEKTMTRSSDNFFSRKLEIVSPSKHQNEPSLRPCLADVNAEDVPTELLCERCEKMIDIDQYDEHVDFHVATELSKSLNAVDVVVRSTTNNQTNKSEHTKKGKKENGQKRKHKSKTSGSDPKKPCTSISSYFKPVLQP